MLDIIILKEQFYQKILLAVSVKLQLLVQLHLQVALSAHIEEFFNKVQQLPLQLQHTVSLITSYVLEVHFKDHKVQVVNIHQMQLHVQNSQLASSSQQVFNLLILNKFVLYIIFKFIFLFTKSCRLNYFRWSNSCCFRDRITKYYWFKS